MFGFSSDARELRVLFLDMNSFFASVEQQENPALRGRPVIVAATSADTTVAIAASYEAKAYGIKTGTRVGDAKRMCPDLHIVSSGHGLYTSYHNRILEVVERILPIDKVLSVDEMQFRLLGNEKRPSQAERLAHSIKMAIREGVGESMLCSVGIAPNSFLAKVATEIEKPDGLVILQEHELPGRLTTLKLTDFPGINRRMLARLQANGIFTTADLLSQNSAQMKRAFGSVIGERWWYLLRGYELKSGEDRQQQALSHSHVLPPEFRTEEGAYKVLLRLTQKAAARLRSHGWATQSVSVYVIGKKSWEIHRRTGALQSTVQMNAVVAEMWEDHCFDEPIQVGIVLGNLVNHADITPNLFDPQPEGDEFSRAMDRVNQKFGKNKVFLAALEDAKGAAPERIAFHKTQLFSEGKADNAQE
ncbi:MAG: DNA polymerase [Fimbriimonadaceae bacterium]|nr:DNA polymerase [Fimbriimonadaceae bacterium]